MTGRVRKANHKSIKYKTILLITYFANAKRCRAFKRTQPFSLEEKKRRKKKDEKKMHFADSTYTNHLRVIMRQINKDEWINNKLLKKTIH